METKHKFEVGEHVAIHGGCYYGHNGKIESLMIRCGTGELSYSVLLLTGPGARDHIETVIDEIDLRAE